MIPIQVVTPPGSGIPTGGWPKHLACRPNPGDTLYNKEPGQHVRITDVGHYQEGDEPPYLILQVDNP